MPCSSLRIVCLVSVTIVSPDIRWHSVKKKFLLANKHITKLNSTLSVRIEELNAQISSLYVENLRLRASEIALAAQLKREREKSRKVMTEAEAATLNLTKHLSYLRQSLNISTSSSAPTTPHSPRARKPPPNRTPANPSSNPPPLPRLSKIPNVPGICEEEEPLLSSSEHEIEKPPSPVLRKSSKSKPRLSASRLPLPARVVEAPPLLPLAEAPLSSELQQVPVKSSTRPRKPSRRHSGLLMISADRSLSVPRAPSPAFGSPIRRAAGLEEEEEEVVTVSEQLMLEADMEVEVELEVETHPKKVRRKSKGKEREAEGGEGVESVPPLPLRERERERERDKKRAKGEDDDDDNTVYDQPDETEVATGRQYQGTSPTPSQPNSRSSSSPVPPEGEGAIGRERRIRKSVNYAEPKLNTKMRKPDPPPGTAPPPQTKKRSSAAAVLPAYQPRLLEDTGNDADNDTEGARSSLELPPSHRMNGNTIDPTLFPLPSSRPPSSLSPTNMAAMLFSPPTPRTSVKRKKSRPQIILDEDAEESEGAQADAEYGYGHGAGWVNVEGRRGGTGGEARRSAAGMMEEARRHSMAV
ncbi:hypothetical protein L208DRAFT_199042 [Tricholoma matsutake]|nr:hypothetical protein L208DRAFT_199042 [Tricholoma matsutake 945]